MASLWIFLAAAVGPLAKKVLVALGIGWLTYSGITAALGVAQNAVVANWNAMAGVTAQFATLFGFSDAVGITLGALAARAALLVVERLGKVVA